MVSESGEPVPPRGLLSQLRSQPILVKLILAFVLMFLLSPLVAGFAVGVAEGGGGVIGALVVVGLSLGALFWLFFGGRRPATTAPAGPLPVMEWAPAQPAHISRYCTECGRDYLSALDACPECAKPWDTGQNFDSIRAIATFLNILTAHRQLLDRATFDRVQSAFEARLHRLRQPVPAEPPLLSATPAFATPAPSLPSAARADATSATSPTAPVPAAPRPPRRTAADARRAVIGWAAERQADILLYVGAFLLSVAAIIFVAYQGDTVNSTTRFLILTAYALGFLVLGLALHRWERVKEAGPAFLALGAILVPIDFVMLRTQIFSDQQVATDVLVFFGSATSTALYFSLAGRGYGWLYAIPGALAALLGWGALGSILDLGIEWYGPWFQVIASPAYVAGLHLQPRWRFAVALTWAAVAVAASALLWSTTAVLVEGDRGAVPLVFLPATIALAAGLRVRRSLPALVALPAMAATTAGTAWWAAFGLPPEWQGVFVAAAAAGYLLVAHFDRDNRAPAWAILASLTAAGALLVVHSSVLVAGADSSALPATYAFVFLLADGAFARWRWTATGIALPVLGAMTLLTAFWSARGIGMEWYGVFAALAAIGYLLLALFDRDARRRLWWASAASAAALALALAHVRIPLDEQAERVALPITYAVVLAAALGAFARWRFQWRLAPAAVPALAVATALTTAWVRWDIDPEWFAAFFAASAGGYIVLAMLDNNAWTRSWLGLGMAAGAIAAGTVYAAQQEAGANHVAVPVVLGELLVFATFISLWWRTLFREAIATVSPLAAGFGASVAWVTADMRVDWLAAWSAGAAVGFLVPATLDRAQRQAWRFGALAVGALALAASHVWALQPDPVQWQLPVVYAVLLAGATWDALARRDLGTLLPPVLAAMLGGSALWAGGVGPEWWPYPAIGIAIVIVLTRYWWRSDPVLDAWGWAYAAVLGAGATLAFLPVHYSMPEHALATQLVAAGLLLVVSLFSGGSIARLLSGRSSAMGQQIERILLVQAAFAFLFGAGASFNGLRGIAEADRAWIFAALAFAGWMLVNLPLKRLSGLWTFAPVGLAGMTLAAIVAGDAPGTLTAVLALATLGPLVALPGGRRWTLLGVANAFLFLAVWAAWRWQDGNLAYLPLAFAGMAVLQWTALVWLRRYRAVMRESDIVITAMSWVPWLLAAGVAGILLDREQQQLAPGASIVDTEEWGLAAAVLAMTCAAVTAEGIRLRLRWLWIAGSAGLLVALLMGIATASPSNVQAYTAPTGVYLVLLGLTFRRSPELAGHQLQVHESVMLAGWLFLVLPPAAQSFDPGGGKFGLELIGIGVALLITGLVLHARWLVPAAVLTLTGVSLRLVTGGLVSTPYWLLLGIAGTALIGFGLLVLLEREAWDRFRVAVVRWWTETQSMGGTLGGPTSTA